MSVATMLNIKLVAITIISFLCSSTYSSKISSTSNSLTPLFIPYTLFIPSCMSFTPMHPTPVQSDQLIKHVTDKEKSARHLKRSQLRDYIHTLYESVAVTLNDPCEHRRLAGLHNTPR
jgi:hypothetical protein